ncbi:hypothetical protein N7448_001556 [Penicillium atrosanguineum]|uniref:Pre-mRNA splicing factor-domain-containing protein n=1 Tax=Penicillium atrosanguineum TaxID=1132637 RepID=UPI00239EBB1A|nr:Pre-mRNA splicing factor-domain-containing protein [Penicillium atrosanguineum]KAJ5149978.1 hypothetical protein N7448_001556 [Penicillium atrosanguineum]KAJ5305294.1 Pre-mRNA splicing factor-domain-containing protein [Penicillium atrosanguineum]
MGPDNEKSPTESQASVDGSTADIESGIAVESKGWLHTLSQKLELLAGLETRGIERVPDDMRGGPTSTKQYLSAALMWFGINCTANSLNVGILGPLAFQLGFVDAILCCIFGTLTGCICAGYISTFGPVSGCRTLVVARYTMGWWPAKLCVVLNIFIALGYGVTNCLTAGLILSAVNGHGMKPWVGIVVSALITWVIATFGYRWFFNFERFCWIPQILIMFIMIGCAGPDFNPDSQSVGVGAELAGNRLTFFFLCMSVPLSWASYAADYYAYFPKDTVKWKVALSTTIGIFLAKVLCLSIGIGLGGGTLTNKSWAEGFDRSTGGLIMASLAPLNSFGNFLGVILALGLVANQVPGAYSASFNLQLLGPWAHKIPRFIWSTIAVVVYTVCAIAGEAYLLTIFNNFLALVGYWTMIWVVITAEEHTIFRQDFNWADWNDRRALPLGWAALVAFLIGWAGAILGMNQVYFIGPVARLVGGGADMGLPIAASWTALSFPPLRYLELKVFGR